MDWKLTPAESQTPSVSWRQSLTDDGSGLQANKLASSMTNPDNISNVGSISDGESVDGYTDIEAGNLKSFMEEAYADMIKYKNDTGKVGKAVQSAIRDISDFCSQKLAFKTIDELIERTKDFYHYLSRNVNLVKSRCWAYSFYKI